MLTIKEMDDELDRLLDNLTPEYVEDFLKRERSPKINLNGLNFSLKNINEKFTFDKLIGGRINVTFIKPLSPEIYNNDLKKAA